MPTHFCEDPRVALCNVRLAIDGTGTPSFYKNTTNTFANVTCKRCQEEIYRTRLGPPANFGRPPEWTGFRFSEKINVSIRHFNRVVKRGQYE